jgi:catechol 2,3-dioxygenase-like lactoylglutathione lyase family enzyme
LVEVVANLPHAPWLAFQMTRPRLDHVMVAIPEGGEKVARDFYVSLLGLAELPKPPALAQRGGLWLSTGTLAIHLGVDPDFNPARKAHIALEYDDLGDVLGRLDRSTISAGPIERELPGYRRCYVSDPFGNRIELMQPE